MAYIGYEDIPARVINNRIVPRLRKYYRADGTFDLFDIYNKQQNCLHFLADRGEASLYAADRYGDYSLGVYNTTITWGSDSSTFNDISVYRRSAYSYNAYCRCAFRLKLNNCAGLYPYVIYLQSSSDHGAGGSYVRLRNKNGGESVISGGGGNRSLTWSPEFGNAANMLDWKDYDSISGEASSADTSKFVRAETWMNVSFIHKFTNDDVLYRYYR